MLKKLLLIVLIIYSTIGFAQKKDSPDHTNFYKEETKETSELKMETTDIVSKIDYLKFKLKLTNYTDDYILYKPKESSVVVGDKTLVASDRMLLISPHDKGSRVIDIKGNGVNTHVDAFTFNLLGLGRINVNVPHLVAPNFKLPASVNEFSVGNFKVQMVKLDKQTDETKVKFKVTYVGRDYGFINPNVIAVKTEKTGDTEYANAKNKQDVVLLANGESETITASFVIPGKVVDMQFANMEILWRDTFKECKWVALPKETFNFTIDEGLTAGKNNK
jgi:hypothetical protein